MRANPAIAKIYGYDSLDELIHKLNNIEKQLYVNPARGKEFVMILLSQQQSFNFEAQVYRRDGSIMWISENTLAIYDFNKKFSC